MNRDLELLVFCNMFYFHFGTVCATFTAVLLMICSALTALHVMASHGGRIQGTFRFTAAA